MDESHSSKFSGINVLHGIGFALLGHVVAIALTYGAALIVARGRLDEDLDTGGRCAVLFFSLHVYIVAQIVLFTLCTSQWRREGIGFGMFAGCVLGILVTVTLAALNVGDGR